jgi:hypothetical protein
MSEINGIPVPERIKRLPIYNGLPVPFFVAWKRANGLPAIASDEDAVPDFRLTDPVKRAASAIRNQCWICGDVLGRHSVFLGSPLILITRNATEGPMHLECANFSAQVCPFLASGLADKSSNREMLKTLQMLEPIPGIAMVYHCTSFKTKKLAGGFYLWIVDEPTQVEWYARGRRATRTEIDGSVRPTLDKLRETAHRENNWAGMEMAMSEFRRWLPKEE